MIREVVLRRFKRFDEERFDLSGHVILAGPNNCGKTTVLQAIAAWDLGLKRWKELNDFQRHGGAYTKAPIARQAFSAVPVRSFDLLWRDRHQNGPVQIEVRLDDGKSVTIEFIKDSTEQIYVRPTSDVDPAVLRSEAIDIDFVYVATVGGLSVEEPVYQAEYIRSLLGRQRSSDVIRNLLLQASADVDGSWSLMTQAVHRLFDVELLVPQTPGGQIVCEYQSRADGPTFDILSAGSGFQQVVLLLACLATRRGSVLLIDEPDAHLHVFLQDTIFSELNRAAAESKSQLVIATHSEVIFNSADPTQICVIAGKPRRLANAAEVQQLRKALEYLQQSDLVAAEETPGILYIEGYTDLDLLRTWAIVLDHPVQAYLNTKPFWRAKHSGVREVAVRDHFDALRLVKPDMTAVWLVDSDGRANVPQSERAEVGKLNRLVWSRYETESYLVHPAALARFIDRQTGTGGNDAVRRYLSDRFDRLAGKGIGESIADGFIADPANPAEIVETFLNTTKARSNIVEGILAAGGVHGMSYTNYAVIAANMLPEEIHPEVREKLDFIQVAFGL